jgi:hypothetical protein
MSNHCEQLRRIHYAARNLVSSRHESFTTDKLYSCQFGNFGSSAIELKSLEVCQPIINCASAKSVAIEYAVTGMKLL